MLNLLYVLILFSSMVVGYYIGTVIFSETKHVNVAPAVDPFIEYGQCGSLGWTLEKWGRITHKHACPNRSDPWCQTHPMECNNDRENT